MPAKSKSQIRFMQMVKGVQSGSIDPGSITQRVRDAADHMDTDDEDLPEKVDEDSVKGGLADKDSVDSIAKKHDVSVDHIQSQLKMGVKVEREHTNSDSVAREIALDHLFEDPNYYTELKKIHQESSQHVRISGLIPHHVLREANAEVDMWPQVMYGDDKIRGWTAEIQDDDGNSWTLRYNNIKDKKQVERQLRKDLKSYFITAIHWGR